MEAIKLTVTPDIERVLRKKLEAVRQIHLREMSAFVRAGASPNQIEKFNQKFFALKERSKRITMNNLLRAALTAGAWKISEDEALKIMDSEGIPMGRPRRAAQGE
jgi:hypothetical protein